MSLSRKAPPGARDRADDRDRAARVDDDVGPSDADAEYVEVGTGPAAAPSAGGPRRAVADTARDGETTGLEPVLSGAMPVDEVVAQIIVRLDELRRDPAVRTLRGKSVACSSCGDDFPAWQAPATDGKCLECRLELAMGIQGDGGRRMGVAVLSALRRQLARHGV